MILVFWCVRITWKPEYARPHILKVYMKIATGCNTNQPIRTHRLAMFIVGMIKLALFTLLGSKFIC